MADNVAITEGSGTTIAADEIAGAKHQRVKVTLGADGTNDGDVSSANPMPITGDITRVRNVVDGTISTVTFVPVVQRVQNVVDGTLTTVTGVDRVRNIVDGTISTVTSLGTATRVDRVMNLIDGTLSTVGAVTGITNSISVHILSTNGTMAVFSRASGTVAVTAADGTFAVRFSPSTPNVAILSNAQPIGNSGVVGATTQRVVHAVDVAQSMNIVAIGTTNTLGVYLSATAGTINVSNVTSGTVAISAKDGTFAVFFSPSRPVVLADNQHTSSIFTVSGTTSTAGNNTLVSPSASYNFKVFAYSLQTTGIVSSAPRFTTGASAGATELWRPLINSVQSSSAPVGANLAIPPPAFLFATGTNTTLSLYLDTGTLIHYSVSFIKESA